MNKKLKLLVVILAAVLLGLGVVALVLALTDGDGTPEVSPQIPALTVPPNLPGSSQDSEGTQELPDGTENGDALLPAEPVEELPEPVESQKPSENQPNSEGQEPSVGAEEKPATSGEMSFPYTVPGSSLVITKIDSYDGIFLEDGSDRSITDVCALVVTNGGTADVEYADIRIKQGSRTLLFKVTVLRAGCTAVVQEANAAPFAEGSYESCTADVAEAEKLEMSEDKVKVVENANGTLTVTNLTDQTIGGIRIFYKFCLTKGSVYVGGITYTAKVENLAPGAAQTVAPNHYVYGSSEVVMVRLYDSLQEAGYAD